jgi:GGDEF domain-containing protein
MESFDNKDEFKKLESKIKELETEIELLTRKLMVDNLTGVFNRRHLEEVEQFKWQDKICYVSFVDSNKLKFINDKLGHSFGDKHLIKIAKYLETFGVVIRYGGDEFIVLSEGQTTLKSTDNFTVGKFIKTKTMTLNQAIINADKEMYKNKVNPREKVF